MIPSIHRKIRLVVNWAICETISFPKGHFCRSTASVFLFETLGYLASPDVKIETRYILSAILSCRRDNYLIISKSLFPHISKMNQVVSPQICLPLSKFKFEMNPRSRRTLHVFLYMNVFFLSRKTNKINPILFRLPEFTVP